LGGCGGGLPLASTAEIQRGVFGSTEDTDIVDEMRKQGLEIL
jgi:hypothetical protein